MTHVLAVSDAVDRWCTQIMIEKCFNKCVSRPGSSLSGSERSCLLGCRQAFSDTMQVCQDAIARKMVRGNAVVCGTHGCWA